MYVDPPQLPIGEHFSVILDPGEGDPAARWIAAAEEIIETLRPYETEEAGAVFYELISDLPILLFELLPADSSIPACALLTHPALVSYTHAIARFLCGEDAVLFVECDPETLTATGRVGAAERRHCHPIPGWLGPIDVDYGYLLPADLSKPPASLHRPALGFVSPHRDDGSVH